MLVHLWGINVKVKQKYLFSMREIVILCVNAYYTELISVFTNKNISLNISLKYFTYGYGSLSARTYNDLPQGLASRNLDFTTFSILKFHFPGHT